MDSGACTAIIVHTYGHNLPRVRELGTRQPYMSLEVTMKSLTRLWQVLANELAGWCGTSVQRDVETLLCRVENEGISFLTISLPNFATDFEKSLSQGSVTSDLFPGFRRKGGLPAFLSGFLRSVFDTHSGVLREDPSVDAIFAIRQLCLIFKKIELRCSPKRESDAQLAFLHCEDDLKEVERNFDSLPLGEFRRISSILFGDVFNAVNREVDDFELSPRHGPGATADKLRGNQKFVQTSWPERLEPFFPYGEYVLPSWRYYEEFPPKFIQPSDELPVKVTLVPKTQKTPRVIAIEPTAMQYMQQALMQSLVPKLETFTMSRDFVGFSDQSVNQRMARKGSLTGTLATLDLSEASDRVLNSLVLEMTKAWPSLSGAVQACRSRTADLPNGRRVRLSKFASMGSALCFPFEAMVFTTLVFMGIQDTVGHRLSATSIKKFAGRVRVYGDDIIVPVESATSIAGTLESFGLKVNRSKSFWTGQFRESCGGDYFNGEDVTPLRLKQLVPESRRDVESLVSSVSLSNALFKRGLWKTADHLRGTVETVLGPISCVPWDSQALGFHSFVGFTADGWDPELQQPLVRAYVTSSPQPINSVDGVWALRKSLESDWSDPMFKSHLMHSGRPSSVRIKKRWVPVG